MRRAVIMSALRLFKGFAPAAGEGFVAFENPTGGAEHKFDCEFGEFGQWIW
jgi:hypothetical protein